MKLLNRNRVDRSQRGFSLMEAVVATLIVGVMLVAALRTVAASRTSQLTVSDRAKGQLLAKDLMAEILTHVYTDPNYTIQIIGPALSELAGPGRSLFNDVDDYHNWTRSPPEFVNGTDMPDLTGWTRSAQVYWADPTDLSQPRISNTGVKHIEVTVKKGDRVVATLTAIRTEAWPEESLGVKVLMVSGGSLVFNFLTMSFAVIPTALETEKITQMESWGFTVNLIHETASQVEFDAQFPDHDVAYVSAEVDDTLLSTKVVNTTIGVVNENADQAIKFGFVDSITEDPNRLGLYVLDNTHYVSSTFPLSVLFLFNNHQTELYLSGTLAPGIQSLGHQSNSALSEPALAVLASGASATGGRTAAGRRVQLPWSGTNLDWNDMTDDAKTIMQRAIEWAADKEQP